MGQCAGRSPEDETADYRESVNGSALRRAVGWVWSAVPFIADPLIVAFGIALIANGDEVYGAVLVLVGVYWLVGAILHVVNRHRRAEGLMTSYALGGFFVLAIFIGVGAVLNLVGGSWWGIGIGVVGLILTALSLRYGTHTVTRWLRARHN
jgi:hypothetical protein